MDESRYEQCRVEIKKTKQFRDKIPGIVDGLVQSCTAGNCFDHVDLEPLPSKEKIIDIIHAATPRSLSGLFFS